MAKVAIVTDSTATIPEDLLKTLPIRVAPQILIWGDETYLDGIDIQPGQFYTRLETAKTMPTTLQVSPSHLINLFGELSRQGYEILCVLISSDLSGTMQSANQAKALLPELKIEIFDSRTTAMAMGYQVLLAARAAADGAGLEECRSIVAKSSQNTGVFFVVDTLEFLHRGGRIGGGARFLGTMLDLKPILEVKDGRVDAVERVRSKRRAFERLLDLVEERIAGSSPVRLATFHANAPQEATELLAAASQRFSPVESFVTELSPVLGTHVGPGTVGLTYLAGM